MTPTPPQIEAEARLLNQILAFLDRKYTHTSDARQSAMGLRYINAETSDLAKELARLFAALSPQPTSQDDAGLCERLRDLANAYDAADEDNGVGTMREAAVRIATLSADVARMRASLIECCDMLETTATQLRSWRVEPVVNVEGGVFRARAALSGKTK